MSQSPLSDEQRACYDVHGYVLLRGFFSAEELFPWHERFVLIVNEEEPPGDEMLVMRDIMVAKGAVAPKSRAHAIAKIQDFHQDEVLYRGYSCNERLLDAVECFTGPDVKTIHSMLINKPPDVDGRHALHQDLLYFPFRPADRIVATWTALEPCTRENGCLVVVPGTHKGGLQKHENPDWEWLNLGYFGVEGADAETERLHLEMEPGDTVFFHPLLWHGSGRNRSAGFRRAISTHYAAADCRFLPGAEPVAGRRPYLLVRGRAHPGCI